MGMACFALAKWVVNTGDFVVGADTQCGTLCGMGPQSQARADTLRLGG